MDARSRWKLLSNTDFRSVLILVLVTAPVLFLNAFKYAFPLGFAGLYTLMAKLIAENRFLLPSQVPFYGPGGIPFAYPPLALYLMAVCIRILQIPIFAYLKFAPPVFAILSIIPTYFLFKEITKSRLISAAAILFFIFLPSYFIDTLRSGGAVRGLANLFALSGLYYGYRALHEKRHLLGLVCGIFFGLTVLTHLAYALFFAITICVFSIHRKNPVQRLGIAAEIALVGLALSSPWWGRLYFTYGVRIFQYALGSHDNLEFARRFVVLFDFRWLSNAYKYAFSGISFLGPIVLPGLAYGLYRKRWMLVSWFGAILLFVSEGGRFLIVVGGILGAWFLFDAVQFLSLRLAPKKQFLPSVLLIEILILSNLLPVLRIASAQPAISSDMLRLASWVQVSSEPSAQYLYLSNSEDDMEWLPYLFQRTPALGHWGSEWTDRYSQQVDLIYEDFACSDHPSANCVLELIANTGVEPEFLIVPKRPGQEVLVSQMRAIGEWPLVYQNDSYWVWKWSGASATGRTRDLPYPPIQT